MLRHLTILRGVITMALLAVMTMVAQPALAQSQQQTWMPDYSPDRHVYVDPLLSNNRQAPVNFNGLESSLIQEGQRHGLQVFVVATQQGSDLLTSDVPGRDALDKLILKWQARSGFPSDNYLIIMWVRRADNPNKGSVAANGGNWFSDWNMTGTYFADPSSGPVIPNLRRFMPQDPAGAFVAIVQTVNNDIDAVKARQAAEEANRKYQQMLPYYVGGGSALLILLGTLIFLAVRFSSRKKKMAALIADWSGKNDNSNTLYLKLRSSYMGFLTEQGDWKGTFKNRTLATYTAACTDFAAFSARRKRADEVLVAARKAFDGDKWPSVKGFAEVEELLTKRVITVTGKDLPLEEVTLFGGLVEKSDYKPAELLNAMKELFDRTNQALAGIVKAFEGAKKNKLDVERLDGEVNAKRTDIQAAELTMEPYEATIAELKRGQTAFVAILSSDPLEAFAGSETVEAGFEALEKRLERAISIKSSLPLVKTQIDGSETKAKGKRGDNAVYLYPLGAGETQPKAAQAVKFLLAEVGSNPDTFVADARTQLAAAHDLVFKAKLDESVAAKAKAEELATYASNLVDDIVSAKLAVEGKVPPARTTLVSLTTELPDADTAVTELTGDFLAANIGSEPKKVTEAHATNDATPDLLVRVKSLYDAQNFVAARALILSTQASLDGARAKLVSAHAVLKELRRLRQDSRDTVASCLATATRLTAKLRENNFTTSAATDTAFADASKKLGLQKIEADKKVADWPAVAKAAHEVVASFKGFDSAIDAQREAYNQAKTDVAELRTATSQAQPYVGNDVCTQGTKDALAQAVATQGQLVNRLNTAKSDWANISTLAESAKTKANDARQAAEAEIKLCGEADAAYDSASRKIGEVSRESYGYSVSADLSDANERLRESANAFRLKQYQTAKDKAKAAFKEAEDADEEATRKAKRKHDEAVQAAAAAAAALAESLKPKSNDGGGFGGGGFGGGGGNPGGGGQSGGGQISSNSGGGSYQGRSGGGNY